MRYNLVVSIKILFGKNIVVQQKTLCWGLVLGSCGWKSLYELIS